MASLAREVTGQTVAWSCDCHVMVLLQVWGCYIIDPVTGCMVTLTWAVAEHQRNSYDYSNCVGSVLTTLVSINLIHCLSINFLSLKPM